MLEFNNNCGCDSGSLNGFTDPSCPAPSVVTWNSIQGKPSCFTPCPHTHVPADIIGLEAYIQSVEYVGNSTTTNSIQLTTPSGVLNANLRLSANAGTGYKVPLSILSDGLIAQIPFASGSNAGILSAANWVTFNNKFSTPSGTVFQYVRGDGSLATFPTFGTLSSVGVTMPAAFGVANSPLTSNGTIAITALGTTAQYIRGDGTLATFPTSVTSVGVSMPAAFAVASSPVTGSGVIAITGAGTVSQYIRGDGTLATFPASPSFLVGSVPFGNGTGLTENNPKFFWDNTLFKLKLTDSKLEFIDTGAIGTYLFGLRYFPIEGLNVFTIDQTDTVYSSSGCYIKLRAQHTVSSAITFGHTTGIETQANQIGLTYNPYGQVINGNELVLRNVFNSTGVVKIQATAYTQIDGLAIKQAAIHTFSNVTPSFNIPYPYNVLRFNYGGTGGPFTIILPFNSFLPIPDGYIVILKALNTHGATQNVDVGVNGPSGQAAEPYTFTKDKESVTYRYDLTGNKWDIIAVYSV
jgi:hypothetical protein